MGSNSKILNKYTNAIKDDISIMENSSKGINSKVFFELVELSGLNKNLLAEEIFDISLKTMQRYHKENLTLNARNSEIALKLLSLFKKGEEIFGNMSSFYSWINKPAYGLGNQIPVKLMNTNTGIDLIAEELIRLEYGALA